MSDLPPALRTLVDATRDECSCSVPTATIVATLRSVADYVENDTWEMPGRGLRVWADAIEKEATP